MRTFIAIDISDEIRDALRQVQSHLKYAGANVKWVEPHNIHLTLKFLGDIDEKKAEEIKQVLDNIGKSISAFDITIKDIGAFPKMEFPRVVWVGLDKGTEESKRLAQAVDDGLSKIGFQKEERPFAAHLTVGRVKSPMNKDKLKAKIKDCQSPASSPHRISSVILFQSTLTPSGPIYTKLHEVKLA
ncbi:MAG: RNA 2',3'-cyclic phosphodiesterase [Candidatus Omnitrophica bacterium]|nr:RNA 2',3'-cyclic phosphodiesterase [Candidatus Omnitrophota bacterium]